MTTDIITTERADLLSDKAKAVADRLRNKANQKLETYEDKVRESPAKAVLMAMGAGYCLSRVPIGTLIAVPLRLTAILAKPALLMLGAIKLCDFVERQSRKN